MNTTTDKLAEALRGLLNSVDCYGMPFDHPARKQARAALEAEAKPAPAEPARPEWMSCAGCDLPNGCPEFCKCGQAPSLLPPIARRRVFDAIAGAYDLGYADRKAGRIGAAKEVEIDHGGALIAALEKAIAAAPAAPARANLRERWNIERDGDDLLVCFNLHEKGEACEYERFVRAPAAPVPAPLTDELVSAAENLLHEVGFGRVVFDTPASERLRAAIAASKGGAA